MYDPWQALLQVKHKQWRSLHESKSVRSTTRGLVRLICYEILEVVHNLFSKKIRQCNAEVLGKYLSFKMWSIARRKRFPLSCPYTHPDHIFKDILREKYGHEAPGRLPLQGTGSRPGDWRLARDSWPLCRVPLVCCICLLNGVGD